jgi:hypothetical protein
MRGNPENNGMRAIDMIRVNNIPIIMFFLNFDYG